MTTWDVDVPAASEVISRAGPQGAAYEGDLAAVNAAFERAAAALSRSPLVVGRLSEFALAYQAWRERELLPDGPYTDEQVAALDPGQNPLPLPTLGVRTTS
ncbi:MAG: hypothetical protein ACRCY9_03750 [Phycicoccus sp.]